MTLEFVMFVSEVNGRGITSFTLMPTYIACVGIASMMRVNMFVNILCESVCVITFFASKQLRVLHDNAALDVSNNGRIN